MSKWFLLSLKHAAAGVETDDSGKVINTAPIWRGWIGKQFNDMILYYKANRTFIYWVRVGSNVKEVNLPNGEEATKV